MIPEIDEKLKGMCFSSMDVLPSMSFWDLPECHIASLSFVLAVIHSFILSVWTKPLKMRYSYVFAQI